MAPDRRRGRAPGGTAKAGARPTIKQYNCDSDEVARAFRDDVARCSDMMSPGVGASLADNFLHSAVGVGQSLDGLAWRGASQAVAGEIDAVGVVDDAIEDGVGIGGIADELVPFVDGSWLVMSVDRRP